jgi:hypothetical protein
MEKKMKRHKDPRIQFVGIRDTEEPYAFLENDGDISFYSWLSGKERRIIGNILKDGFQLVKEQLKEVQKKSWEFDEKTEDEFIEATGDMPLWARMSKGNYFIEELEELDPETLDKVVDLAELWEDRIKKLRN